jgi:hypothetical protein
VKTLSELYPECKWSERLEFINRKYLGRDDYDISLLYLLTYSLRGKYIRDYRRIYEDVYEMIFDHEITQDTPVVLLKETNTASLGSFMELHLNQYYEVMEEVFSMMGIRYEVINSIEKYNGEGILIYPHSVLDKSTEKVNYISPFPYAFAKNADEAMAYNILLNVFNCCYSDTITGHGDRYEIVYFNIH